LKKRRPELKYQVRGVAHETFTGTVTANPDFTAKYTISVYDDSGNLVRTSVLDTVYTHSGRKARVVFESIVLPDGSSLPSVLKHRRGKVLEPAQPNAIKLGGSPEVEGTRGEPPEV